MCHKSDKIYSAYYKIYYGLHAAAPGFWLGSGPSDPSGGRAASNSAFRARLGLLMHDHGRGIV